ncbi:hypothetical protein C8F04DRAFT_1256071 [Mycena alexandri]|uniref:Uncharacterized protein n=1 Tax=Mycena alexandri TaxID=1745969 RepID=A0AAD6T6X6_9AGAR|nr:hypothetical protein C8F04DRAFT_1256071 [Mycena alexandri]
MTYDIYEKLKAMNRLSRCRPLRPGESENPAPSDSDDGDTSWPSGEEEPLPDLHYVWENGRKVRLLGIVQRQHQAQFQDLIDRHDAIRAYKAASRAFPKDRTPQRPWTQKERRHADVYLPEDRVYNFREFSLDPHVLGSDPGLASLFELTRWTGRRSPALPVVDRTRYVICVAGGIHPDAAVVDAATKAFEYAAELCLPLKPKPDEAENVFRSLCAGVTYNGTHAPNCPLPTKIREAFALDHLVRHVAVRHLAAFGNDVFTAFAPAAYHLASELTTSLLKDDPTLTPPFPGVFTTATFGVGPRIVGDVQHPGAAPWCWIALTALGSFDPERGGHIIFWDLGRVLQFPPRRNDSNALSPALHHR